MSYFPISTTNKGTFFHKASVDSAIATGKDDATESNAKTSCWLNSEQRKNILYPLKCIGKAVCSYM